MNYQQSSNNNYGGYSAYNKEQYQRDHDYHLQNGYKERPTQGKYEKKYTGPSVAKELANTLRDISLQSGSGGTSQTSFSVADVEEAKFIMLRASSSVIGSSAIVAHIAPLAFWLALVFSPKDSLFAILVGIYFFLSTPVFYYTFWSAYTLRESKGFAISDVAKRFYSRYMMIWVSIEWIVLAIVASVVIGWYYLMVANTSWIIALAEKLPKRVNTDKITLFLSNALPHTVGALWHFVAFCLFLIALYYLMSRKVLKRATKEQSDRRMEALVAELSNAEVAEGILDGKY